MSKSSLPRSCQLTFSYSCTHTHIQFNITRTNHIILKLFS
jgi:hypothetical protein